MTDDTPTPDLTALVSTLVTDDPKFRAHVAARLEELVDETFDVVLDILTDGDLASRTAVAKQVLPVFLKVRKDSEELDTAEATETYAAVRAMISDMGDQQPGAAVLPILTDPAVDVDTPPIPVADIPL